MMTNTQPAGTGRVEFLAPEGLIKSPAYSHVAVVSGQVRTIYVGGQDAIRPDGVIVGKGDLGAQATQILENIQTALAAAGAGLEHVVQWNVNVVEGYPVGPAYEAFRRVWGDRSTPPPLITVAVVTGLANPDFLAEMDVIAVVPD